MKKKNIPLFLLRTALLILVVINATVIFLFSAQTGESSNQQSEKLESAVSDAFIPNYAPDKPEAERTWWDSNLHIFLRKAAHVTVFGTLTSLIFLLLLTWRGDALSRYVSALSLTLLYATSDEVHQTFVDGRSGAFTDILIDFAGGVLFATVILLVVTWLRRKDPKLKLTSYTVDATEGTPPLRIAVASDLHGKMHKETLALLRATAPDLILIPGDLMDDKELLKEECGGYRFLSECAQIAPTYYSLGNHEIACYHKGNPWRHPTPRLPSPEVRARIKETGVHLLDNDGVLYGNLYVCALTSGINKKENAPNPDALRSFAQREEFRILLCHHPEYYVPYIRQTNINLTVCGHAHGGQWRFFSQGVYAPGQGLFPKYTAGLLDGRCVISRGIGNHTWIPRLFNEPELLLLHLAPPSKEE